MTPDAVVPAQLAPDWQESDWVAPDGTQKPSEPQTLLWHWQAAVHDVQAPWRVGSDGALWEHCHAPFLHCIVPIEVVPAQLADEVQLPGGLAGTQSPPTQSPSEH